MSLTDGTKTIAYTSPEKMALLDLISKHRIVNSKRTDGHTLKIKNQIWESITNAYNSLSETQTKRTSKQLRKLWANLKQKKKKENTAINKCVERNEVIVIPLEKSMNISEVEPPQIEVLVPSIDPVPCVVHSYYDSTSSVDLDNELSFTNSPNSNQVQPASETESISSDNKNIVKRKPVDNLSRLRIKRLNLSIQHLETEHEARMELLNLEKQKMLLEIQILNEKKV